ncbi:hypothetical protein SAMN05444166_2683 [Singulisphaera sp. GP187]|uniref:hypothetical protein n=1 Tax=Singulisphaera sp. GP187 TaxID=1882752 RepID=UPI00092A055D|nr:hypothetical protein [Singulisphaera sp. GP187]SIO14411.1 hypothetical protein SAMN05444166_2683 [Singulisphaera sp. GP187]
MKRVRLSTLLLLVIIVALIMTLAMQGRRAGQREAELDAKIKKLEDYHDMLGWHEANEDRIRQHRPIQGVEGHPAIEPMEIIERGKR